MTVNVLHSVNSWLPLTTNWLYDSVRWLPDSVDNVILCARYIESEISKMPNTYCSNVFDHPKWKRFLAGRLHLRWWPDHADVLTELTRKHQVHIVHSHFGNRGWLDHEAVLRAGAKHVVTFYGYDLSLLPNNDSRWLKRYKNLFRSVDLVLAEGPHMASTLVNLGCPEGKVKVHHLGVVVDEIPFKQRSWNKGDVLHVLIAATFTEKKGIPYALEALGRVKEEMPLQVTIIGDATDSPRLVAEKNRIMEVIVNKGLEPVIRIMGYQPRSVLLEEAYKHHLFLSPSVTASDGDTEGGAPVSLIEMAATGIPIISTTHCDIPEVILNGKTGMLAEERDVDSLVDKIRTLVEVPDKFKKMAVAGRQHIEEEFDAIIQGQRLLNHYLGILE